MDLGKIYQKDCLEIMKDIPDKSVDLVFTDPPYNVGKNYGIYKDKLTDKEYLNLIDFSTYTFDRIASKGMIIVLGSENVRKWWNYIPNAKMIIVKVGAIYNIRIKGLALQYHTILTTVKANKLDVDLWENVRWPGEGYFFNEERYKHPALTPLKLTKKCISLFSNEGDIILDPFIGCGTTAVACKELGRKWIGIELNPDYVEIAKRRLAQEELF